MGKKDSKQTPGVDNIQNLISDTADTTVMRMIRELKKQSLLKDNRSAFQKTETVLYSYNNFKETIANKYKQIDTIMVAGSNKKSSSITSFSSNNSFDILSDSEKAEEQIAKLKQSITSIECFIKIIDDAISELANDKYYKIIRLKYFENKTREEIAEQFDNCDVKTITRNKNRLINKLKIDLFSDESLFEILS